MLKLLTVVLLILSLKKEEGAELFILRFFPQIFCPKWDQIRFLAHIL